MKKYSAARQNYQTSWSCRGPMFRKLPRFAENLAMLVTEPKASHLEPRPLQ